MANDYTLVSNLRYPIGTDNVDERGDVVYQKNKFVLNCGVFVNDIDKEIVVDYNVKRIDDGEEIERADRQVYDETGRHEGAYENQAEYDAYIAQRDVLRDERQTLRAQRDVLRDELDALLANPNSTQGDISAKEAEIDANRDAIQANREATEALQEVVPIPLMVKKYDDVRPFIDSTGLLDIEFVKTVVLRGKVTLVDFL